MFKTVTLSGGLPCRVRVLGLFELDGKGRELLGPYRYKLSLATGEVVEDEFNLGAFPEPPRPPNVPVEDIKPGTWEYAQLQQYETYLAAVAYEKERAASYEGYVEDITGYILASCLEAGDQNRVTEPDDWRLVYEAALVPALTEEVIADTLRDTFQGVVQ